MKFARFFIIGFIILLIMSTSFAFAEWTYTAPKLVTDTVLTDEITAFLSNELGNLFPALSETQKQQISISTIHEYPDQSGWSVDLVYKDCPNFFMSLKIIRTSDNSLQITDTLPWAFEELVELYESCISYEDAVAIARIHLAVAIYRACQMEENEISQFVEEYGFSALDPTHFVEEAAFITPQNGGIKDSAPEWSFYFGFAKDEQAGANWTVNPLWYEISIDASSGVILEEKYYGSLIWLK